MRAASVAASLVCAVGSPAAEAVDGVAVAAFDDADHAARMAEAIADGRIQAAWTNRDAPVVRYARLDLPPRNSAANFHDLAPWVVTLTPRAALGDGLLVAVLLPGVARLTDAPTVATLTVGEAAPASGDHLLAYRVTVAASDVVLHCRWPSGELAVAHDLTTRFALTGAYGSLSICSPSVRTAKVSELAQVDAIDLTWWPGACDAAGASGTGPSLRWQGWTRWRDTGQGKDPAVTWSEGAPAAPCTVVAADTAGLASVGTTRASVRFVKSGGETVAWVSGPCGDRVCTAEPVNLGGIVGARLAAWVDLRGAPSTVDISAPFTRSPDPASGAWPAALIVTESTAAGWRTRTAWLVAPDGGPLWRFDLEHRAADGGGTVTRPTIGFVEDGSAVLAIELVGEALPRAGDATFRPGPPQHFRFVWSGQAYVRR